MNKLRDAISGEILAPSQSTYLNLRTKLGEVSLRINATTAKKVAKEGVSSFSPLRDETYKSTNFWGSYYGQSVKGSVQGSFVRDVVLSISDKDVINSMDLNIFFNDSDYISKSLNHNTAEGMDDCVRCDCRGNDCNCDCPCDC
jgi:hypothetical protein